MNDNELSILELIHLFVEVLDGYFGNVCELDLVFHFDKVHGCSLFSHRHSYKHALLEIVNGLAIQVIPCDASLMFLFSLCLTCFFLCVSLMMFWMSLRILFVLPARFQVYRILDELLLAGEVSETSTSKIIAIMKSVDKMD